ncbi:PAS domain S-box protein [Alteromonas pelagimontana]|uniref:histidine kinase n=1 Tax=Alteromonas pelagimontana TaxID=1858656 RepID=A0A6M4MGP1_9ALTE|nr:MHYT domain-containing protein [Alteromonas pelagimontana]QJR82364.1 PAS domain S-box protein [Alteromonas pelagimontana]
MNVGLSSFFEVPTGALVLAGESSLPLVAVSVFIAISASYIAFRTAGQARGTDNPLYKQILLGVGSLALAGGIWAMHFIGMLALEVCTPISYNVTLTAVSFLPSLAAAWVALYNIIFKRVSPGQIMLAGLLVGAGIGCMHYTGMAAMEMAPLLRYDLGLFLLSLVVAVVLSMLSLWIKFGLTRFTRLSKTGIKLRLIASIVMGSAISGMHYTGMIAARFVMPPGLENSTQSDTISLYLASGVVFFTSVIIVLVLGVSLLIRYREISEQAYRSQQTQQAILDTAIDGILKIDENGIIRKANPAITDILGWETEEMVGQSVLMIIPEHKRYLYDNNVFLHRTVPAHEKIIGASREVTVLNKQGEEIPARVGLGHTQVHGHNYFVAFIADIRERIEMESAIRESEAKFRSFIGNIPGIAYRCMDRADWLMEFISDAVEDITGYPASDFLLPNPIRSFADLYHPDDLANIYGQRGDSQKFSLEYRIIHRDGSIRWLREEGAYMLSDDKSKTWLDGFIMDITSRRLMENELINAKVDAEQAAAARSAFLANMSHEIRTPMNAIIGFSDFLLDEVLEKEQHKHVVTINRSARSLLHLLNDILDSAKLDKGKLELEYRDFIITDEVDTVISTFWLEAKRKGLELNVELSPDLAHTYHGVPERIRQVLNNLLGNAVKFTGAGEVTVTVTPHLKDQVQFTVKDTGIGMTEDQLAHVFDAFAQADASMSRKYGGTGLGTTISKQLVELMGGTIEAFSKEKSGSEFKFVLPLKAAKPAELIVETSEINLPPLRVLVVDDITQNVDLIALLLRRHGHVVTSACDGVQALEKMAADSFDVVLMDLQMPIMDGLTATKKRREYEALHHLKRLPIVALTASVLVQDKDAASEAGMEGFANKPIDFPLLNREIARVLGIDLSLSPEKAHKQQAAIKVIDRVKGEALWGDRKTHNAEILRFMANLEESLDLLQQAQAENSDRDIQRISHSLKGVTGNLGLSRLMQLFKKMEHAAQRNASIKTLLAQLQEEIQALECQLEVGTTEPAAESSGLVDMRALHSTLQAVLASVKHNRLDENLLFELSELEQGRYCKDIRSICTDIDEFEFERAEQKLKLVIDRIEIE